LEPLWTLEPLWALEACGAGVSKARANPNWLVPFNGSAMFANFLRGLAKTGGGVLEPFHYSSKHPSSPCPEACQPIGSGRPISTTTLAHRAHRGPLLAGPVSWQADLLSHWPFHDVRHPDCLSGRPRHRRGCSSRCGHRRTRSGGRREGQEIAPARASRVDAGPGPPGRSPSMSARDAAAPRV